MLDAKIVLSLMLGALLAAAVLLALWRLWRTKPVERETYIQPEFLKNAGFRVTDLPGDETINYRRSWLLWGEVGELEFRADPDWLVQLRVAKLGTDLRLEDFDQQYTSNQVVYYDDIRVVLRQNEGGSAMATWANQGFHYALYLPRTQMGLLNGIAINFVRETKSEAV